MSMKLINSMGERVFWQSLLCRLGNSVEKFRNAFLSSFVIVPTFHYGEWCLVYCCLAYGQQQSRKKVCKCDVIIHRSRKNMHINDNRQHETDKVVENGTSFMMQFRCKIFTIFRSILLPTMSVLYIKKIVHLFFGSDTSVLAVRMH